MHSYSHFQIWSERGCFGRPLFGLLEHPAAKVETNGDGVMLDFNTYKKALGESAQFLTDKEIDRRRNHEDQLSDVLFDMWRIEENQNKNLAPKTAINESESVG